MLYLVVPKVTTGLWTANYVQYQKMFELEIHFVRVALSSASIKFINIIEKEVTYGMQTFPNLSIKNK